MSIFRTIIVPAAAVADARSQALALGEAGMFTTALSADGSEPATHYVSSGVLPDAVAQLSGDGWIVSDEPAVDAIANAGLAIVRTDWLAVDKAAMWERIKAERDRRKLDGGYTAAGKWFHSDTFSRTQQIGLVMLGANIPANTPWKTMDGSFVTMTQTLAGQVFAAAAAQDMATFHAAEVHKAAMEASANPLAYDYLTGWPAIYGE